MEQREKLGLSPRGKNRQYAEPTSAMDKVQVCMYDWNLR